MEKCRFFFLQFDKKLLVDFQDLPSFHTLFVYKFETKTL